MDRSIRGLADDALRHARRPFFSTKTLWNFVALLPYSRCVGFSFKNKGDTKCVPLSYSHLSSWSCHVVRSRVRGLLHDFTHWTASPLTHSQCAPAPCLPSNVDPRDSNLPIFSRLIVLNARRIRRRGDRRTRVAELVRPRVPASFGHVRRNSACVPAPRHIVREQGVCSGTVKKMASAAAQNCRGLPMPLWSEPPSL